jgi:excisionase family DNA binding protein
MSSSYTPRKPLPPLPPPQPPRRWASPRDTAAYAGVSPRTIGQMIADGRLPAYRYGPRLIRIDLNDVDALMVPVPSGATG